MKINIKNILSISMMTIIATFAGISIAQAWTSPTCDAPDCNVSEPINTSSNSQSKPSLLIVNDLISNGIVGVGGTSVSCNETDVDGNHIFEGSMRYNGAQKRLEVCKSISGSYVWGGMGGKFINGDSSADAVFTTGKVGIGTTNPTSTLTVKSDQESTGVGNQSSQLKVGKNGSGEIILGTHNGLPFISGQGSGANYKLLLNPVNGGNVGIGTTNPSVKLEVNGDARLKSVQLKDQNGSVDSHWGIYGWDNELQFTARNSDWSFKSLPLTINYLNNNIGVGGISNPLINIAVGDNDTGINQDGDGVLEFWSNGQDRMHISNNGNVGIGTDTPAQKVHVNGGLIQVSNVGKTLTIGSQNEDWAHFYTDASKFYFNHGVTVDTGLIGSYNETLQLQVAGSTKMALTSAGNVGIGTISPSKKLDVRGTGSFNRMVTFSSNLSGQDDFVNSPITIRERGMAGDGDGEGRDSPNINFHWSGRVSNSFWMGSGGRMHYGSYDGSGVPAADGTIVAGSYLYNSDETLKKNISKLKNYKDILKIDAVRFNWKKDGRADVGIIAQNVQEYFPEFVFKDGNGKLSVDYPKLSVPMLNLLQDQEERLNKQEKELKKLKVAIKRLQK